MDWSVFDYAVACGAAAFIGGTIFFTLRFSRQPFQRAGVFLASLTAVLLFWVSGAVGLVGSEDTGFNGLYLILIGLVMAGAVFVKLRAPDMSRLLLGAAALQALLGAIAIAAHAGDEFPKWPWDVAVGSALFAGLWLAAALCFRRAARASRPA